MILADKIIELRKKNGWSQEELAEKLDVSRQAVSKWESAQSVPDMNRILLLSEVFGVSTDYLLKDEMGEAQAIQDPLPEDSGKTLRKVSLSEAQAFLQYRQKNALRIAAGVVMCVLSPVALILFAVGQETGRLALTEQQAVGLGMLPLFLLVGGAVALFILSGVAGKPYEYLQQECFETEYGVSGYVREQQTKQHGFLVSRLVTGVVLCVLSAVPIFIAMLVPGPESDFPYALAVAALLARVAACAGLSVYAAIRRSGFSVLLEEGEHSRENKQMLRRTQPIATVYWSLVTAGYLAYSFITMRWDRSWIVWPVAGVLYGVVLAVAAAVRRSSDK